MGVKPGLRPLPREQVLPVLDRLESARELSAVCRHAGTAQEPSAAAQGVL